MKALGKREFTQCIGEFWGVPQPTGNATALRSILIVGRRIDWKELGPVFVDTSKITAIVPLGKGSRLLPSQVTFNLTPDELIVRLMGA